MVDDVSFVDKIVTKFVFDTCRLRSHLTQHALQAAVYGALIASGQLRCRGHDTEVENIPLTTGSVAEFYIEPLLPHVGDVDIMYHTNNMLAIPQGHPPPIQLPACLLYTSDAADE